MTMVENAQLADIEDIMELSPMQEGMLFQSLLAPTTGVFFEQLVIPLGSGLDVPAFESAWQAIIDRTPVLRTSFYWGDLEKPVQIVHRKVNITLEHLDWMATPHKDRTQRMDNFLKEARLAGFDLDTPPLMRFSLIRMAFNEQWFVWHFHHILLDGWSGQLLLSELLDQYRALTAGQAYRGPERRPFSDYIKWVQNRDMVKAENFWKKMLDNFSAPTTLGIGRLSTGTLPPEGNEGQFVLQLSKPFSDTLRDFAQDCRLTLSTIFQGAWAILLSRYSQDTDVLFGIVVSGRPAELPGIENMIGLFINTIPLRVSVQPDARLLPWLKELQSSQIQASNFQYISPLQLQQWSNLPARSKAYDSVLIFENFPIAAVDEGNVADQRQFYLGRTDVDLTIIVMPEDALHLKFLFNHHRLDSGSISRLAGHLELLLKGFAESSDAGKTPLSALSLLTFEERHKILVEWNNTDVPGFDEKPLMQLMEERVASSPDAVVLVENDREITLSEVHERSNRLAQYLIDRDVSPGAVVGVCLELSIDAVITFLGVLKARGVYLPLDPSYPRERLVYMMEDCSAQLVITKDELSRLFTHVDLVDLSTAAADISNQDATLPMPHAEPGNLAYILYTSGSTGLPKGAAVDYRTILNRLHWMWRAYPFVEGEVMIMRTALNFVDSLWEMLGGVLQGVPTVIAPDRVARDPGSFIQLLAEHNVTRLFLVPSYLELLLASNPTLGKDLPTLRFWFCGGEPLVIELYQRFRQSVPDGTLFNIYGTSELWDATIFDTSKTEAAGELLPVGHPIDNTEVYVLDNNLEPVPIGIVGRLHVGGVCLARGYVNRPNLTAKHFIPHIFSDNPNARLYDTGDLAKLLPDGSLVVVGREDDQINLRGFRIEPGEIESLINKHPGVHESVVLSRAYGDSDTRLVAYVVAAGGHRDTKEVLAYLSQNLPAFMVPAAVVWVETIPKTPSGKRNRRALLELEIPSIERRTSAIPQNDIEKSLVTHFQNILGVTAVGIHDDFFAHLGGHSLLATRLVSRVRDEFGVEIPLREVFDAPTVAQLAGEITRRLGADDDSSSIEAIMAELEGLSADEIETLLADLDEYETGE